MSFHVAFSPIYVHAVPEGHRFPMLKYDLLQQQLVLEGLVEPADFILASPIQLKYLKDVHSETYLNKLISLNCTPKEQRVSGFEHNSELIQRELVIMEATRLCAKLALESNGVALNIAGGTHHAYADRGEGFCLLNDHAIAANWLLKEQLTERILIIDLDVHQGNGTAAIFQNNPSVFTFSFHGASNYPLKKESSDLDVALPDGTNDQQYLSLLTAHLSNVIAEFKPTFFFYQSGVDVLATDKLGKLGLSIEGTKQRDRIVFEFAKSLNIPIVCSMGGGYSKEIRYIVEAHMNTFRLAHFYFS